MLKNLSKNLNFINDKHIYFSYNLSDIHPKIKKNVAFTRKWMKDRLETYCSDSNIDKPIDGNYPGILVEYIIIAELQKYIPPKPEILKAAQEIKQKLSTEKLYT